jgi:hypothetical protein
MTSRGTLPEPKHPFARWGAGAAISIWALGVQYFSVPFDKLGAIISPGIGYVLGQSLDLIIFRLAKRNSEKDVQRQLQKNKRKIDDLYKEKQELISVGADPGTIKAVDALIIEYLQIRVQIFAKEQ